MAVLHLPQFVHARNLPEALAFSSQVLSQSVSSPLCDASQLTFVDPMGLCLLAATCAQLAEQGKQLRLENVPEEIVGYLARMDLFKACGIEHDEKVGRQNREADLIEISMLNSIAGVDDLANKIANALVGATPDSDVTAEADEMTGYRPYDHLYIPLRHIFSELLENSLTHGRRAGYKGAVAWAAAQYYPSNDRIRLAVLDNGCGLLRSLSRHPDLEEQSHIAAARLALRPRITCNPDLDIRPNETANQGVGLTVVRGISREGKGVMRVVSGDSLLELLGDKERERDVAFWQGVILAFEFKREYLRKTNLSQVIQQLAHTPGLQTPRFE